MNTLPCIKCNTPYQEEDVEAYYCPACKKTKEAIAKDIDAKYAHRPKKKVMSDLEVYDASPKVRGFVITRL